MFGFFRIIFLATKISPTPKSPFENAMGNAFLGTKRSTKKMLNSNFIALYLKKKTVFGYDPRPWEVPKPENTRLRAQICNFYVFSGSVLPEVRDRIQKQFFNKVLYNYCFCGAFRPKKGRFKNGFPTVFLAKKKI